MTRAVIDVGSNSILLATMRFENGAWRQIDESSAVTGLGAGVKSTGVLGEAGMIASLEALQKAWLRAESNGATEVRAGGTMALRIASNAEDFRARAAAQGTPVTILPGDVEAELGLLCVLNDAAFASHRRITVIDVGGHSSEIATAERDAIGRWKVEFRHSFPVGTLGLLSSFFPDECPSPAQLLKACVALDDVFEATKQIDGAGVAVALGATGTNLVSIRNKLATWEPDLVHQAWLDYEEIARSVGWLSQLTLPQRAAVVGMEPGREGTIHIGSLILERALYALRAEGCFVSVKGWRHAWLERDFAMDVQSMQEPDA